MSEAIRTTAVRLYGKMDLRLETFDLPKPGDDEIVAHVISDSICMSSHKAVLQGADHKRVPNDIAENPTIIGHEFCGEIVTVGAKWKNRYRAGDRFVIQPALNYKGSLDAPGYSFRWVGGDATYVIMPNEVMEMDCLLPYTGDAYYFGSLTEPMSCIVGAFRASYHVRQGTYNHQMGIESGGKMAILAGVGPMGLGAVDLALHGDVRPSLLVVTDIDEERLERARDLFPVEAAAADGIELHFINTRDMFDPVGELRALTRKPGFDDVFVMAPVKPVVEMGDRLLAKGGCLNFFAGPTNTAFTAEINFYDLHYEGHQYVGTSGGNTEDMRIAIDLMQQGRINPSIMITHVGGLTAVVDTTLNLPKISGGKKLMYTNVDLPLTAIADFDVLGRGEAVGGRLQDGEEESVPTTFWADLAEIVNRNDGLWNGEAEKYMLAHAPVLKTE